MLRKFLLSTALVTIAGAASAADLPYRTAAPAPYVAAPVFTWTGFYVGLNAGAAFNNRNSASIATSGLTAPNNVFYTDGGNGDNTSFTGGVTAGYNMQFGSFVAGVEGDFNYLNRRNGGSGVFPAPVDFPGTFDDRTDFTVSRGGGNNWFGTLRGRLGFAFDRAMIFATGGLAFGGKGGGFGVTQRDYYEINPGAFLVTGVRPLASSGSDSSSVGWALGGGAEYALTQSMSVKLEYLHVDLGSRSQTFATLASAGAPPNGPPIGATMGAGNTITVHQKNNFNLLRAGVNFRF
jgi:outer membrane immunogenic protein